MEKHRSGEKIRIESAMREIEKIFLNHGIAIFFAHQPGKIWIDGHEYGTIDNDPEGCGHAFVIAPHTRKPLK